jgi:hypothetical protein
MLEFDPDRVRVNVRRATTEDLLDRATAYRAGMEPDALAIIEDELRDRGVGPDQIDAHARKRERETFLLPDGTASPCSFCHRPAVGQGWGWHRLWGLLPLFPRYFFYCDEHLSR